MFYTTDDWLPVKFKKRSGDLGFDLPAVKAYSVKPGELRTIDTGIRIAFPFFGKVRRFFWRLLLGYDVAGIGAHVWGRGIGNHVILAGVIDVGYRGTIKVKVYNPTDEVMYFSEGDKIAQLVMMPCINPPMKFTRAYLGTTDRGEAGGINVR